MLPNPALILSPHTAGHVEATFNRPDRLRQAPAARGSAAVISIGPYPIALLAVPVAMVVAVAVGLRLARRVPEHRKAVFPALVDTLGVGLLAARLGFVVRWWPLYAADPWAIVLIGDGGFLWWAGAPAAMAFAIWRMRRTPPLRRPLGGAVLAGGTSWLVVLGMLALLRGSPLPLPDVELRTLDGETVPLSQYAGGPLVVNLWATWCPPCLREMPVLAEAQRQRPEIAFVFANQGERADEVRQYLAASGLALDGVLLDHFSRVAREVGSRGLPTTLFFNARGELVDTHVGELTRAGLAERLRAFDRDERTVTREPER
jgi:thiol-disulfide isomerase/thioredoxin